MKNRKKLKKFRMEFNFPKDLIAQDEKYNRYNKYNHNFFNKVPFKKIDKNLV